MEFKFIYPILVTAADGTEFKAGEIEMRADLIPSQADPEDWEVDELYASNLDTRQNDWTRLEPRSYWHDQAILFMQRDHDTARDLDDEWGAYVFEHHTPRSRIISPHEHSTYWGRP